MEDPVVPLERNLYGHPLAELVVILNTRPVTVWQMRENENLDQFDEKIESEKHVKMRNILKMWSMREHEKKCLKRKTNNDNTDNVQQSAW